MPKIQVKYKPIPESTREENLCLALSMVEDMPELLDRAIEGYDDDSLTLNGQRAILNAKLFRDEFLKLKRQFAGALEELSEMHGLDPLEVSYDN